MATRRGRARRWLVIAGFYAAGFAGCSSDPSDAASSLPAVVPDVNVVPNTPYVLTVGTHCGVARLGLPVNNVFWITDEAAGSVHDWLPTEWEKSVEGGLIPLTIVLSNDGSELQAASANHAVTYRPVVEADDLVFCD